MHSWPSEQPLGVRLPFLWIVSGSHCQGLHVARSPVDCFQIPKSKLIRLTGQRGEWWRERVFESSPSRVREHSCSVDMFLQLTWCMMHSFTWIIYRHARKRLLKKEVEHAYGMSLFPHSTILLYFRAWCLQKWSDLRGSEFKQFGIGLDPDLKFYF